MFTVITAITRNYFLIEPREHQRVELKRSQVMIKLPSQGTSPVPE